MIFNERYDRSLWLMIYGDRINRDKIVYLIKSIPKEIYDDIHKQLENINDSEIVVERNLLAVDGFMYHYIISFSKSKFSLNLSRRNQFDYILNEEEFVLDLFNIGYMDNSDDFSVGNFSCHLVQTDFTDFDNRIISKTTCNESYTKHKFLLWKLLCFRRFPGFSFIKENDGYLSDISKFNKNCCVGNLVRVRKNNRL